MDLSYPSALPPEEFADRRNRLFAQMREDSALLVFSAVEQRRNSDSCYPFRQDSYFWYLTGFNEPNSLLLLQKQQGQCRSHIFVRPSDPLMETWNGRRLGVERAPAALGLDQAYSIGDLAQLLPKILEKSTALYHYQDWQPWAESLLAPLRLPAERLCWKGMLDEMRLFKSQNEIALIQQAGQISAFGHLRAMQQTRPNRLEYEIAAEIDYEFSRHGARFCAYNSIIAGGENACILHYTENDKVLRDGDLVLIDAGCEFALYAGDITRTFPVNGKFNEAQKAVYQLVLNAQKKAIELLVAGSSINTANDAVIRLKVEGLIALGILQGEVDQLIADNAHRRFYMHGLGHWLGLDVHGVGEYGENRSRPLEVGMVLTVEPGLYIPDEEDIPPQYRGIGVRIEDNLLITDYGNKNLTAAVPKEIEEIEQLMQDARHV